MTFLCTCFNSSFNRDWNVHISIVFLKIEVISFTNAIVIENFLFNELTEQYHFEA